MLVLFLTQILNLSSLGGCTFLGGRGGQTDNGFKTAPPPTLQTPRAGLVPEENVLWFFFFFIRKLK